VACALQGTTDEQLAAMLGVSLSAVKKVWISIHSRVQDSMPGIIPAPTPAIPASGRGKESGAVCCGISVNIRRNCALFREGCLEKTGLCASRSRQGRGPESREWLEWQPGGVVSRRIRRTLVSLAGVAPGRQPGDAVRIRLTVSTVALGISRRQDIQQGGSCRGSRRPATSNPTNNLTSPLFGSTTQTLANGLGSTRPPAPRTAALSHRCPAISEPKARAHGFPLPQPGAPPNRAVATEHGVDSARGRDAEIFSRC
jgi:hypothetical protein